MAERRRAEKAELAALKSHARASAHHAARFVDGESPTPRPHHAARAVDGESPTPRPHHAARAVDGPQTNTMTDAKMLQLVSMLEKACNLRDRALGTPVAARNVHCIDEAISAITAYASGRVLAECEQEAGVGIGHGSTSETYGGGQAQRHIALARSVEYLADHATTVAEDCLAKMAGEGWQGPPGIPTARSTDPSAARAVRAGDDTAKPDAEIWQPVTRGRSGVDEGALGHVPDGSV